MDRGGYLCRQRWGTALCRSQLGSAVWQWWKQPIAHQNFSQWYFNTWYCSNLLYKEWQQQEAKRGRAGVDRWGDVRRMGKQDSWKIDFGDVAGDGFWKADVPLSGLQAVEGSWWSRKNLMETVVCGETHSGAEENELESRNRGRKCIRSKKRQKETIKETHMETPLLPSWSQLLFLPLFVFWICHNNNFSFFLFPTEEHPCQKWCEDGQRRPHWSLHSTCHSVASAWPTQKSMGENDGKEKTAKWTEKWK